MDDQIIRLRFQAVGQETIDGLRKSTENYKALLAALTEQFNKGEIDAAKFRKEEAALASEFAKQAKLLDDIAEAQRRQADSLKSAMADFAAEADRHNEKLIAEKRAAEQAAEAMQRQAEAEERAAREAQDLASATALLGRGEYELAQATRETFVSASMLANEYELLLTKEERAALEAEHLENQMRAVAASIKLTTADAQRLGSDLVTTGAGAGRAGISVGNLNNLVMQGSFAFQDFASTSGDLGMKLSSVANNLSYAAAGFGLVGAAIGVASVAGIALYRNWDDLTRAFAHKEPIDDARKSVDDMSKALEKDKDELQKLKDLQSLTNTELARYNELLKSTAQQEAELNAARAAEQSRKAPDAETRERAQQAAKIRDGVGGAQFERDVRAALAKADPNFAKNSPGEFNKSVQGFIAEFLSGAMSAPGGRLPAFDYLQTNVSAFGKSGQALDYVQNEPGRKAAEQRRAEADREQKRQEEQSRKLGEWFDDQADAVDQGQAVANRRIGDWFDQQAENVDAQMQADAPRRQAKMGRDVANKASAAGNLDEQALFRALQGYGQGDPEKQQAEMAKGLAEALGRRGCSAEQSQAGGAELARRAMEQAKLQMGEAVNLAQNNLNLAGMGVQAMGQMSAEMAQMQARQMTLEQAYADLMRASQQRAQTRQRRGSF